MLEHLVLQTQAYIEASPQLALAAVFVGGALTASNPCALATVPLMVSFVAGRDERGLGPLRALGYSAVFVLGLAISFVALGMTAALAGSLYGQGPNAWKWVVAGVSVLMGLHLLGVLRFPIPAPAGLQPKARGALGALLLGLLFGLVSAPCAAPVLIVLLTYIAGSGSSVAYGGLLLLAYALGHSLLVLLAGTSMGVARRLVESGRVTRVTEVMRRAAGGVIVLVGLYFAYLGLG